MAYSDGVPLGFDPSWWEDLQIEGYVPGRSENMKIFRNVVSPGYFRLMRIPLLDGRDFTEHDDEKSQKRDDRKSDVRPPLLRIETPLAGAYTVGASGSPWWER